MSRTHYPMIPGTHRYANKTERLMRTGEIWFDYEALNRRPVIVAATEWDDLAIDDEPVLAECPEFEDFDFEEWPIPDAEDWRYVDALQDDLWAEDDHDADHWMPYVSIEQAREIFGGSDFTIRKW